MRGAWFSSLQVGTELIIIKHPCMCTHACDQERQGVEIWNLSELDRIWGSFLAKSVLLSCSEASLGCWRRPRYPDGTLSSPSPPGHLSSHVSDLCPPFTLVVLGWLGTPGLLLFCPSRCFSSYCCLVCACWNALHHVRITLNVIQHAYWANPSPQVCNLDFSWMLMNSDVPRGAYALAHSCIQQIDTYWLLPCTRHSVGTGAEPGAPQTVLESRGLRPWVAQFLDPLPPGSELFLW